MGKNQNLVVVLRIGLKFWWMIPMGVRDNHIKHEPETHRWRPGTAVASGGPRFLKLQFRAKNSRLSPANLHKIWDFRGPFWAVSGTYGGVRGQQRAR